MIAVGPSPGWDLLLETIGGIARSDIGVLEGLSDGEWSQLLTECNLHWLTPVVYRAILHHRDRLAVPPATWRGFKKAYRLSMARTRRADAVLLPVLAAFEASGIPVVLLKGMHLSIEVYDTPPARPMVDADLLVHRAHVAAAVRIVESFGFRQRDDGAKPDPTPELHDRGDSNHLGKFWCPNGPPIEIHDHLEAPNALPHLRVDEVWDRARRLRIDSVSALALSREDTLLHLCTHAAFHHRFGVKLLNICDIPVAIERWRDDIDWAAFWARARDWGVERSAQLVFAFTQYRCGYALPEGAASQIASHAALAPLLRTAEEQMRLRAAILARRRLAATHDPGIGVLIQLKRRLTLRSGAALLASRIFVERRELAASFGVAPGSPWLPVLYPVRLAGLLREYVPGVLKSLRLRPRERRQQQAAFDAQREMWALNAIGFRMEADAETLGAWLRGD
ncbi:MAG: nucleotidyltransferase family protein [Vicinamibacterales bacterium]